MKKIFLPFLALLISSTPLQAATSDQTSDNNNTTASIIAAINNVGTTIKQAISSAITTINTQLTKTLNIIFTGHENGTLSNTSILMRTYELFIKNLYAWYSNRNFDDIKKSLATSREQLGSMLAQEAAYNGERTQADRKRDTTYLLTTVGEAAPNNLTATDLGLTTQNLLPFGGLDYNSSNAGNYLSINDLLGPTTYTSAQQKKAKTLIAHLLNSGQTPSTIVIPSKSEAVDNIVVFQTTDTNGNVTSTEISTKNNPGSSNSEYDRMVSYLKKNSTYQKMKLNNRINNLVKSLFAEIIYRPYEERIPREQNNSLLAIERKLAEEGLSSDYYTNLKKQTAADVNLEMLHAINKMVYFLNKVHEDNERLAIINTIMVQKLDAFTSAQTEYTDLRTVNNLIVNKCWDITDDNQSACNSAESNVVVVN